MEEEKKEVVEEAEEVKEEEKVAEPEPVEEKKEEGGMTQNCKHALAAFIASIVGLVFAAGWFIGAIIGIVGGILGMNFLKKIDGEVEKQPFKVFSKIAKPVSIVSLILGIASLVGWTIWAIVVIVGVAVAASQGGIAVLVALF